MNSLAKLSLSGALLTILTLMLSWFIHSGEDGTFVEGDILLNGKPLANVNVFYVGADATSSVSGRTDADGHYTLTKRLKSGAYRVLLRGFIGNGAEAVLPGMGTDGVDSGQLEVAMSARYRAAAGGKLTRRQIADLPQALPEEWSSLKRSELLVEIPDRRSYVADIELNAKTPANRSNDRRVAHGR